jgi:hypothetical protein
LGAGLVLSIVAGASGWARAQGVCSGIAPVAGATLSSFPVASGLPGRLLLVTAPPGDRDRLFIVQQEGIIRIHHRGQAPTITTIFLDITDRVQASPVFDEMGLLGVAFDPDYETNGLFYVNYTSGGAAGPWFTNLSRFSRSDTDPNAGDPDSEQLLLRFQQRRRTTTAASSSSGTTGSSTRRRVTVAAGETSTAPAATARTAPTSWARCCGWTCAGSIRTE